jgi:hypothetical protein
VITDLIVPLLSANRSMTYDHQCSVDILPAELLLTCTSVGDNGISAFVTAAMIGVDPL